ncbi:MAG: non-canonical purine NTP pyrophosphatase [Spirochaetota bacterium]
MTEICFASHNPAKLARYRALVAPLGCALRSLGDLGVTTKIDEPYATSMENAWHKAHAYAKLVHLPVLAVDEELSTNFLPEHLQPGVLVRRLGRQLEHDPSDREVLAHWLELIQNHPHPDQRFTWTFSIAFWDQVSWVEGSVQVRQENEVATRVSRQIRPGYPMSSFLSPAGTGRLPWAETPPELVSRAERENFAPFIAAFGRWLGELREARRAEH